MGLKIGVCGAGKFSRSFIQLFKAHPDVSEVYLADLEAERVRELAADAGIRRTFDSLESLCRSDCDAVAIFTQRWLHAPQAIHALRAGKHVYSAVPAAVSIEELHALVEAVRETGQIYMLGETSYYRPQTVYCRERFRKGDFGHFVYGEGQYYHDMADGFYEAYQRSGGLEWKRTASFPPMLYPTHSIGYILGVTAERLTHVSCLGFDDRHDDGVFLQDVSAWGNTFSNQTALFRTSGGGMARINEFRRISAGKSCLSIFGTQGTYEEQPGGAVWIDRGTEAMQAVPYQRNKVDVSHIMESQGVEITEENLGDLPRTCLGQKFRGVSTVHPIHRIPKEFIGLPNGHGGSHQFLVVDFVEALTTGRLPPNHVWMAARYNAPGIVAHASAQKEGERLAIPDFGGPPADAPLMDPLSVLS